MKFTITKIPQNVIFTFGIVFVTIAVAFIFIYKPKEAMVKKLRHDLKAVEASLVNIHAIVGSDSDLGKGILRLRDEAAAFEAKFIRPDSVSEFLEMLSSEARAQGLELVSIQPSEFSTCYTDKGKPVKFDNMECDKISIEMQVIGSYRQIADYMDALENKRTLCLKIERFNMDRQDDPSRLKAYIVVDSFALIKINE